jgi:hypothetical protein
MIRFHDFKHGAIDVACECPPIPIRKFDWSAIQDGTYDADYDYEAECYVSRCPLGTGETVSEAIQDVIEQLDEQLEEQSDDN